MTPRLVGNQLARSGLRRRRDALVRNDLKKYLKKLLGGGRVLSQSIEAGPSDSWVCLSPSWTDMKIERTTSEICTAEFASWTILNEDLGNDDFLEECMILYEWWTCVCDYYVDDSTVSSPGLSPILPLFPPWCGDEEECCPCCCECQEMILLKEEHLEEGMALFGEWTATDDEDVEELVELPVTPNTCTVVAIPSSKGQFSLPSPPVDLVRALACPDLLMASLSVLLFETRHLHYFNERLALSSPPQWMIDMEKTKELDPPNSLVSTVTLPSGWDAVSARLSSSSIFNLFSDRAASPMPSLFSIDPTGVPSTGSTVSVPSSFWDTPSTVSVTGPALTSAVSIPSTFFDPRPLTSTTSSLFVDPSEESSSSSISTLFMDPSSVHSSCTGCTSSSSDLLIQTLSSSSLSSICPDCQCVHSYDGSNYDDESTTEFEQSHLTYTISSASSGYDSDEDNEPVLLKMTTVSTQTDSLSQNATARMLAECDEMLEKLVEMKKKLRDLL